MENNQISLLKVVFFSLFIYAIIFIIAMIASSQTMVISVTLGYLLGFFYIIGGYLSIRRAFGKTQKFFFRVVFGSMAIRFSLFAFVLFMLVKYTQYSVAGFIFSFFLFYLFLQIQEIRFINSELKGRKSDVKTGHEPDGGGTR